MATSSQIHFSSLRLRVGRHSRCTCGDIDLAMHPAGPQPPCEGRTFLARVPRVGRFLLSSEHVDSFMDLCIGPKTDCVMD